MTTRIFRNIQAFLLGVLLITLLAISVNASASPFYINMDQFGKPPTWYESDDAICQYLITRVASGYSYGSCQVTGVDYRTIYVDGVNYLNRHYKKYVIPVTGSTNPTAYSYDFAGVDPLPPSYQPPSSCSSDPITAGELGIQTKGIYNYQGCAYSCDIDMSLMDGATSYSNIWARSECDALEADYVTADPADYPGYVEPEGCYTDASGKQICKAPDPGCYSVDGKQQCPENNEICGIQNGAWSCVNPETEGCGLFNGFKICYTIDGTMVSSDSPDHPDNGGNLDGDETNDLKDSRDPTTEGGDPNNQVTDGKGNATEGTAIKSLNELKAIKEAIGKIPGGGGSSANVTVDNQIDLQPLMDEVSGLKEDVSAGQMSTIENSVVNPLAPGQTADTELSNFESTISGESDAVGVDMVDSVGNTVGNLIPQGTCQDLGFTFKGHVFGLDCAKTQKIRDLLSWAFYIMTVWYIFETITTPTVRRT